MMFRILSKLFSYNERELDKARLVLKQVNELEDSVSKLTDEELKGSTEYFRAKLNLTEEIILRRKTSLKLPSKEQLLEERKKLFAIMPEVYARVREAAKRTTRHRHFDVQIIAGVLLAQNKVTEMYTGEGKTNVVHLPAYLYSLTGWGVHIHTVNDYLAKRDAEWAGHVFDVLGSTVATITSDKSYCFISDAQALDLKGESVREQLATKDLGNMSTLTGSNLREVDKRTAYQCDVLYGQASEFGFDYLRDNMASSLEERVQTVHYFAAVDEADEILIDEARTPLIISVPDSESSEMYYKFAELVEHLEETLDYTVDEKSHGVVLTDNGISKVEKYLNRDDIWSDNLVIKHIDNALKAKALYKLDREYIVKNGEVFIVDEFTGRVQEGRRYSEGLHQAIEAKERVNIKQESKTLATISYQNYFRLYSFLAGMTGTAMTEAEEFKKIYDLDAVKVPTYKPIIRKDFPDIIYKTKEVKNRAIIEDIKENYKNGRPVLVGTTSITNSELISDMLKQEGIPHEVLNAKRHEYESKIIAKAGHKGAVTIATNMAGRGTDIKISDEVRELGGLYVIGTERHEARRIDNQLRGRAGRLGDPGASRFYLSLEDDLVRIFGGDLIKTLFTGAGLPENVPLESGLISKIIEKAQQKVESLHFDVRKSLVEYDDVLNKQRDIVYEMRLTVLEKLRDEDLTARRVKLKNTEISDFCNYLRTFSLKSSDKTYDKNYTALQLWIIKQVLDRVAELDFNIESDRSIMDSMFPEIIQNEVLKKLNMESIEEILNSKETNAVNTFLIEAFNLQLENLEAPEIVKEYEKYLVLSTMDFLWMEHIDAMADLKEAVRFRGYSQKDPLVEYRHEGSLLFKKFFISLRDMISMKAFRVKVERVKEEDPLKQARYTDSKQSGVNLTKEETLSNSNRRRISRNAPCPCGSGKKYKRCCYPKYG